MQLEIWNVAGEKVKSFEKEIQPAGKHSLVWDGANMPNGNYFYKLQLADNLINGSLQKSE